MRRRSILLAVLASFGAGIALAYLVLAPRASDTATDEGESPQGRKVLYWHDPMVPGQRFDKPGKSPFMDMQLVPKYADEADGSTVAIDPALAQSLGVRTARATTGTLPRTVRATGNVAFDERAAAVVSAPVDAIVERLHLRAVLDPVNAGTPLFTLLAPEWAGALGEYRALLRARTQGLEPLRDAARRRLVLLGIPEAHIRAVERGESGGPRLTLAAPRAGVLRELLVREGESVTAGSVLARINGLDPIWIEVAVAERDAAGIRAGTRATASVPARPEAAFEGVVEALLPSVDTQTRTLTARVVLANPHGELVPGMFAEVVLEPGHEARDTVLVPSEAVIETGERRVVIVASDTGRYRAQEVRVGATSGDMTQILEGVSDGERVVLSGQFLLDSEATLSSALARLDPGSASAREPDAARDRAPAPVHEAEGTVEAVEGRVVTIATGEIPSLDMPPMSMDFTAPAGISLEGIEVGTPVRIRFVSDDEGFVLDALEARTPRPGAKP